MATPSAPGTVSSSSSAPRWGRSGEPGSAFSGLSSRPGRGRGRGGHRGGGRGSGRGNSKAASKVTDEHLPTDKSDSRPPPPSATLAASAPAAVSAPEKSSAPVQSSSTKPKPASRRASRASPAVINTQVPSADVSPAPASARPSHNRRRSSQIGKSNASIPPKINPPALGDNLVRPNRPRVAQVPHTAPIKDAPPHINQKIDIRNDIDALVERVRAVAMDNRPATPGSHIDWAGDDDDSLPDLDDWGISPATFAANKLDVISPIIVEGLKPLPEMSNNSPPSAQSAAHPVKDSSANTKSSPLVQGRKLESPLPSSTSEPQKNVPTARKESQAPQTKAGAKEQQQAPLDHVSNRRLLHPSLPAKPIVAPAVSTSRSRVGATPMRNVAHTKSPINPSLEAKDSYEDGKPEHQEKEKAVVEQVLTEHTNNLDQNLKVVEVMHDAEIPAALSSAPNPLTIQVVPADGAKDSAPKDDVFKNLDGLGASIHAPKAMADSLSAPPTVSSYSDVSLHAHITHGHNHGHTRAHTMGKPSSFNKYSPHEHTSRFARSGQSTPRDGSEGSYHSRTRSSPPIGTQTRPHNATRPIITGDAISRLARTIGKPRTTSSKPQTVASSTD
ncbi:hypothetical protein CPC08DRAFT_705802 [Agrocybe pediades]|nr:hypothetical protein CPC08DRAFT_705802 [Agrocybe pediades]